MTARPRTPTARRLLATGAALVVGGVALVATPAVVAAEELGTGVATGPSATTGAGAATGDDAATGTGRGGQSLTVTPGHDLDPGGETVTVNGTGFPTTGDLSVVYGPEPVDGADPTAFPVRALVTSSEIGAEGSFAVELVVAAVVRDDDGEPQDLTGGAFVSTLRADGAPDPDGAWTTSVAVTFAGAAVAPVPPAASVPPPPAAPGAPSAGAAATAATGSDRALAARGSGTRTGTGARGQTLTVTPVDALDPTGETVTITGAGYDASAGFAIATGGLYVGFCVDNGPLVAPSPCVGGVDMGGDSGASRWVTNNPIGDAPAVPMAPNGSFSTEITLRSADQYVDCLALPAGQRCVVVTRVDHRASGDRRQDVKVPVCFLGETVCPTDPIEPPPPGPPPPGPGPTPDPPPTGTTPSGTRTGTGPRGQTLTATPVDDLDPAGTEVEIVGRGFTDAAGFAIDEGGLYLSFCVDNGAGAQPTPCVGGVDTEGASGSSQWVTNNPYVGVPATPVAADGSFTTSITVAARDEFVDCLALPAGQRCVIVSRVDHRNTGDRSQDVKVPVCFAGEAACATDPIDPTAVSGGNAPFAGYPLAQPAAVSSGAPRALAATGLAGRTLVPVGLALIGGGAVLVLLARRPAGRARLAVVAARPAPPT